MSGNHFTIDFEKKLTHFLRLLRRQWTSSIHFTSKDSEWELHSFFRLIAFVCEVGKVFPTEESEFLWLAVEFGTRFMYLATVDFNIQSELIGYARQVQVTDLSSLNIDFSGHFFHLSEDGNEVFLTLRFLRLKTRSKITSLAELHNRIKVVLTPAVQGNIIRIFAAVMVGSALLLEGPPGRLQNATFSLLIF